MVNYQKIDQRLHVRSFSSGEVKCIKDYVKSCMRENEPGHIIIHGRTNNLSSEENAEKLLNRL